MKYTIHHPIIKEIILLSDTCPVSMKQQAIDDIKHMLLNDKYKRIVLEKDKPVISKWDFNSISCGFSWQCSKLGWDFWAELMDYNVYEKI